MQQHLDKLPSVTKKEISILSPQEQAALHTAASTSNTLSAFGIIFTLSTGIRLGELLGLQWDDLDYSNHTIQIRRTIGRLQKVDAAGNLIPRTAGVPTTEIVARSPKSANARRTIPLFPQVWDDLMIYRDKQNSMLQASTTLNLYAHALPDHKKQSMDKMSSFYGTKLAANE